MKKLKIEAAAGYTVAKIDAARITKAGRELFERMPLEIRQNEKLSYDVDHERRDRVKAILSLMARHAQRSWSSAENASSKPPVAEYYYRQSYKYTGEQRDAFKRLARKAEEEWTARWELEQMRADERLAALAALLSEITGYTWAINASGGGRGDVLTIPEGLTGARANSTSYHDGKPAIWLSGH